MFNLKKLKNQIESCISKIPWEAYFGQFPLFQLLCPVKSLSRSVVFFQRGEKCTNEVKLMGFPLFSCSLFKRLD